MGQPVVHFEIIGKDGEALWHVYSELFGWEIATDNPMNYGMVARESVNAEGVARRRDRRLPRLRESRVTFYVEVPDVEGGAREVKAESLRRHADHGPGQLSTPACVEELGLVRRPRGPRDRGRRPLQ